MYRTTKRQTAQDAVAKAKLKAESSRELRETKTASATLAKAACSGSYPSTKPQDRWTGWSTRDPQSGRERAVPRIRRRGEEPLGGAGWARRTAEPGGYGLQVRLAVRLATRFV